MIYSIGGEGPQLEIEIRDGMTRAEILKLWDEFEAHPLYSAATTALVLLKPLIRCNLCDAEIADLEKKNRRFKPLRWAIVAPDNLALGISRLFITQMNDESIFFVCTDEESAREWLRFRA